jgi:hypothetical protein
MLARHREVPATPVSLEQRKLCVQHTFHSGNEGYVQVTLFVCIIYRHATLATDGQESTLEKPILIKDFVFGVSDDHKHNARVRRVFLGICTLYVVYVGDVCRGCMLYYG